MKKYWPTIFLVLLCAAGFWYASSQSWFQEPAEPEHSPLLVNGEGAEKVVNLMLISPDETVELQLGEAGWTMLQPDEFPVNPFMIEQWLTAFESMSYTDKIEGQSANMAEFGLDSPAHQLAVQWDDGADHTLSVGSASPVSAHYYVRVDEEDTVFTLPESTVTSLTKGAIDLIEKNVFKLSYNQVEALEVQWQGQQWLLEKQETEKAPYEASWSLGGVTLEPPQGSALLDSLTTIYTDELPMPFEAFEDGAAAAEASSDLIIKVRENRDGEVAEYTFTGYLQEDSVRVHKEGSPWIYSAGSAEIEQWFQQGLAFLEGE
ncbi:DUF4340 domain-containing protein [Paenibacillus senegalensis]|uniref:DUF4340 domain-containing protein n=1 Tax=Paenibacillus senegalensis TaxID=1465766 RepID=UPI0011DE046E|nr:DUF4340 domain-containing protein [Paenibacillus senegalensis]